jgi:hypothetical protein
MNAEEKIKELPLTRPTPIVNQPNLPFKNPGYGPVKGPL